MLHVQLHLETTSILADFSYNIYTVELLMEFESFQIIPLLLQAALVAQCLVLLQKNTIYMHPPPPNNKIKYFTISVEIASLKG